jgi:hypothetical protein
MQRKVQIELTQDEPDAQWRVEVKGPYAGYTALFYSLGDALALLPHAVNGSLGREVGKSAFFEESQ